MTRDGESAWYVQLRGVLTKIEARTCMYTGRCLFNYLLLAIERTTKQFASLTPQAPGVRSHCQDLTRKPSYPSSPRCPSHRAAIDSGASSSSAGGDCLPRGLTHQKEYMCQTAYEHKIKMPSQQAITKLGATAGMSSQKVLARPF